MFSLASTYNPLKRFHKYILKRALGNFLLNEDLAQLEVQLGDGVLNLSNLELNVEVLNDLVRDLPIRFVSGKVRLLTATIPWRNIFTERCKLKIEGLDVIVIPSVEDTSKHSNSFADMCRSSVLDIKEKEMEMELEQNIRLHKEEQSRAPKSKTSSRIPVTGDASDEGLQFVATFLERLVAQTELEVKDLSIRVFHGRSPQSRVILTLKMSGLSYAAEQEKNGSQDHKAIKFHGFQVLLGEEIGRAHV